MTRAGLLVVVLTVGGLAGACDDLQSSALTVNGEDVSRSSVDDDLQALRDNDVLAEATSQAPSGALTRSPGTINSAYSADWLTLIVQSTVVDQELARRDVDVTDADREQAEQQAQQAFGSPEAFADFPQSFQDRLIDRLAGFVALQGVVQDQAALGQLFMDADVDVDPRFGRWSKDDAAVVPPTRT
ncbi:MAG: hypothetical protein ACRDWD_04940 [Acidimicrobiia bacterium]